MTNEPRTLGAATTLVLGALLAAAIWLAGSPELSFAGFITAALAREGELARCRP